MPRVCKLQSWSTVPESAGRKTAARLCYSIARHEAVGWRAWLVSVSGYSSQACKAECMCRLVEAAAVLPPADAMALSGRPIAMAHHISSLSSSSSIPTEKAGKKAALQAAGRWTPSLSQPCGATS